ncbi:MAG: hypothetical protein Kow0065_02300 [Methylomicrobium sp.]
MAHVHGAKKMTNAVKTVAEQASMPMQHSMNHQAGKALTAGLAASAGKSTVKAILTHPVTLIGIGFALGYLTYRFLTQPEEE